MEDTKLPPAQSAQPDNATDSLDATVANAPVSSYSLTQKTYPIENLEVHSEGQAVSPKETSMPTLLSVPFSRRKAVVVSLFITLAVILVGAAASALLVRWRASQPQTPSSSQLNVPTQELTFDNAEDDNILPELQGSEDALLVNGDFITRGNLQVVSGDFSSTLATQDLTADQTISLPNQSGVLCLDSNNCNFVTEEQLEQLAVLDPGVSLLNGTTGDITLQGVDNRVIITTNNGVISISTPQDIAAISSPTFASLLLSNGLVVGGTIDTALNCSGLANGGTISTNASGHLICANDDDSGGGGAVTSLNSLVGVLTLQGTANQVNVASGGSTITLSTPQDIATTSSPTFNNMTLNGDLDVLGGDVIASAGPLRVASLNSNLALGVSSHSTDIYGGVNGVRLHTGAAGVDITLNSADQIILNPTGTIELQNDTNVTGDLTASSSVVTPHLTNTGALQITSQGAGITVDSGNGNISLLDSTNISGDLDVSGNLAFGSSGSVPILRNDLISISHDITADCTFSCSGISLVVNGMVNSIGNAGIRSRVSQTGSGTFMAAAFYAGSASLGVGGSIGDNYGLHIQNQTAGATDYGVYIAGADTAAIWVDNGATLLDGTLTVGGAATLNSTLTVAGNASYNGNTTIGNANTDTLTVTSVIQGANPLVFEGPTVDANDLTLAVAALTSNQTITLPNATGTVCLTSGNCAGVGGTGDILNNGQNGPITVGTNNNTSFFLESNGTNRVEIQGDGDVALDTNTLFVDAVNNRVGVGTATPDALLKVIDTSQPPIQVGGGTAATPVLDVIGGKGGDTSGTTGQEAGAGSDIYLTGGEGGDAPSGSENGVGGSIYLQGGAPGSGAGLANGYGAVVMQESGGHVGIGTTGDSGVKLTVANAVTDEAGEYVVEVDKFVDVTSTGFVLSNHFVHGTFYGGSIDAGGVLRFPGGGGEISVNESGFDYDLNGAGAQIDSNVNGYRAWLELQGSGGGTLSSYAGFKVETPTITATNTIGDFYGLYLGDFGSASITNGYGIFQEGASDVNHFAGNVGINNTNPNNRLNLNTLTTADAAAQLAVNTGGTTNKGIIVQGVASQSADLFQAQSSTGTVLASISSTGDLTVQNATINGTLTVNGHIVTANASGITTVVEGGACGAGSASVSGNDTAGTITITTGGGACASGTLGTVTFASAFGAAPRVVLTPANTFGAGLQYYNGTTNTTTFTLDTATNPAATTTYIYNYHVMQ